MSYTLTENEAKLPQAIVYLGRLPEKAGSCLGYCRAALASIGLRLPPPQHPHSTALACYHVLAAAVIGAGLFLARPAPTPAPIPPASTPGPASAAPAYAVGPDGYRRLPDPSLTPGDTLPVVSGDVCASGYAGKVRNVPESVKKSVYAEYKFVPKAGEHFEVDHLISLELGGSNSVKNLWPEPYFGPCNARVKDFYENWLHREVCAGRMTLQVAQQHISHDWVAHYTQDVGPIPAPKPRR